MRLRIYTYPFVHKLNNKLINTLVNIYVLEREDLKPPQKKIFLVSNRGRQIINSYFTTSIRTILTLLLPQNSIFL